MKKNVWIDMENSPHVPLLMPFIKELKERGYTILITARDFAQTLDLLDAENIPYVQIGKHGGGMKIFKILELIIRAIQLAIFAKGKNVYFALCHGSRGQSLACKFLGIPCYIGMDYEHTESKIFAAVAAKIWMPELLFPQALPIIGIAEDRVITYKGIKEQFYLKDFIPDPHFKEKIGIPADKILVVLRPPAEMAHYHDAKSVALIRPIVENLIASNDVFTICTPRTLEQKVKLKKLETPNFKVLEKAVDGRNLMYYVDTMISGGGTMNREAAFFGAHVYSIFSGKKPMLDLELQKLGLLSFIISSADCKAMKFRKKSPVETELFNYEENQLQRLLNSIIQNLQKKNPDINVPSIGLNPNYLPIKE